MPNVMYPAPPAGYSGDDPAKQAQAEPVVVASDANADTMNKLHGERYGVDWVYPVRPAEPQQPFGYFCDWGDDSFGLQRIAMYYGEPGSATCDDWNRSPSVHKNLPLYTHPAPKREPLHIHKIAELAMQSGAHDEQLLAFARAIEAAHGITKDQS